MCVRGDRGKRRVGWKKRGKTQAERRGEGECGIVLSDTKGGEKRVKRKGEKGENAGKEKHWLERAAAGKEEGSRPL